MDATVSLITNLARFSLRETKLLSKFTIIAGNVDTGKWRIQNIDRVPAQL